MARGCVAARVAALAVGSLAAYVLALRVRRRWRAQLALADLLVSLRDGGGEPAGAKAGAKASASSSAPRRALPEALVAELARAFSAMFASSRMNAALLRGPQSWRRAVVARLFELHVTLAADGGRVRFFADPVRRAPNTELPLVTCFASVSAPGDGQPGLAEIASAGGLQTFWHLGTAAFLRSYRFETWLVALRARVAPSPLYICIEQLFVRDTHQGTGLGTRLVRGVLAEAHERHLGVMCVVLDENLLHFYSRLGFVVLAHEIYSDNVSSQGKGESSPAALPLKQLNFPVWLLWHDQSDSASDSTLWR